MEDRVRAICCRFRGDEKLSHGAPFFVKKQFLMLWIDGTTTTNFLISGAPHRRVHRSSSRPSRNDSSGRPTSVGAAGLAFDSTGRSIGTRSQLCAQDAYRTVAPKKLIAALDLSAEG